MRRSERTIRARMVVPPSRARVVRLDAKTMAWAGAGAALLLVMGYWLGSSVGRGNAPTAAVTANTDALAAKQTPAAPIASPKAPSGERAEHRSADSAPAGAIANVPAGEAALARPRAAEPIAPLVPVRQAETKPREPDERAVAQASRADARRAAPPSAAKAGAAPGPEDRVNSPLVAVPTRKPEDTVVRTRAQSTAGNGLISPVRDPGF